MDYQGGPNVITTVHIREEERQEGQSREGDVTRSRGWNGVEEATSQRMQPLVAEKGKEMKSPVKPPGGTHPCQPILDF